VQDVAEAVRQGVREGQEAVVGRVIDVKGFSTLPGDVLVAVDSTGTQHGEMLGRPGAERLRTAAAAMLAAGAPGLETLTISIHGQEVAEVGLACGGQAELLLQPASTIPAELWELLAARAPAALLTRIQGPGAGPAAQVVDRDGQSWGSLDGGPVDARLIKEAVAALAAGRSSTRRLEDETGVVLLEAWVPAPRLVVVGSGEMVAAIRAQSGLLGWDCQATEDAARLDELFEWAGATAALIVLSHDPHVDTPALAAGLAQNVPYVGAMGSRATQSRRLERLTATGVDPSALDRIHRPIGLDLGGRRAPEVALAIAAEILACHTGRDARPLRNASGPINDRPTA
jgi:xanthine dehydrogenase accessory factor